MREDLQRIIDELDGIDRSADALAGRLSDEQFHWQPDGGRAWSVAQCLEHLAVINAFYITPVRKGVDDARARGLKGGGPIRSTIFGRTFIRTLEPPVTWRMRASSGMVPRSAGNREEILLAFHAAHDRVRDTVRAAADIDVNRATYMNPFLTFVRMRVGTGLRIITAHDRRHLWQAEQVLLKPGFPR